MVEIRGNSMHGWTKIPGNNMKIVIMSSALSYTPEFRIVSCSQSFRSRSRWDMKAFATDIWH